jgi:truncated hemoglobin YjbI
LIENEVSLQDLKKMTNKFYEFTFQDETLYKLISSHSDPHEDHFSKFIHQKLMGSNIWDHDRKTRNLTPRLVAGGWTAIVHDRFSAHVAA